jgi:hypothetical protein
LDASKLQLGLYPVAVSSFGISAPNWYFARAVFFDDGCLGGFDLISSTDFINTGFGLPGG